MEPAVFHAWDGRGGKLGNCQAALFIIGGCEMGRPPFHNPPQQHYNAGQAGAYVSQSSHPHFAIYRQWDLLTSNSEGEIFRCSVNRFLAAKQHQSSS